MLCGWLRCVCGLFLSLLFFFLLIRTLLPCSKSRTNLCHAGPLHFNVLPGNHLFFRSIGDWVAGGKKKNKKQKHSCVHIMDPARTPWRHSSTTMGWSSAGAMWPVSSLAADSEASSLRSSQARDDNQPQNRAETPNPPSSVRPSSKKLFSTPRFFLAAAASGYDAISAQPLISFVCEFVKHCVLVRLRPPLCRALLLPSDDKIKRKGKQNDENHSTCHRRFACGGFLCRGLRPSTHPPR